MSSATFNKFSRKTHSSGFPKNSASLKEPNNTSLDRASFGIYSSFSESDSSRSVSVGAFALSGQDTREYTNQSTAQSNTDEMKSSGQLDLNWISNGAYNIQDLENLNLENPGVFTSSNSGFIHGLRQNDGSQFDYQAQANPFLDTTAQMAVLNTALSTQLGYSSDQTGMGASYTVAENMQNGATFGEAINAANGTQWRLASQRQTINRTGAQLADNAGSAENPATVAVALVETSAIRFLTSGNTLISIAEASGVKRENIFVAHSRAEFEQYLIQAAEINKKICDEKRAKGELGPDEKYGGLMVLTHFHGYANGQGPDAVSGGTFGSEQQIELPQIQAKIKGGFAWGATMNGSCHSGGFDGKVEEHLATAEDAHYQSHGKSLATVG